MNEKIALTRENLITRFLEKDIEVTDFSLSLHDVRTAEFVSFKCDITGKTKCLKSRYSHSPKPGSIF